MNPNNNSIINNTEFIGPSLLPNCKQGSNIQNYKPFFPINNFEFEDKNKPITLITKKSIILLNKLEKEEVSRVPLLINNNELFKTLIKAKTAQIKSKTKNKIQILNSIEAKPENLNTSIGPGLIKYKDNLYEYLKSLTPYLPNLRKRGISIKYEQNNSYYFKNNNQLNIGTYFAITNINKLLNSFFKSIYCIISKPVFLITGDKVIIQLFYYLNIPKYKIYKWFAIFYNNQIRNYYIILNNKLKKKNIYNRFLKRNLSLKNRYFNIKLKKAILKLKSKYFKLRTSLASNTNMLPANNNFLIFKLFKNNLNKVYQYKFKIICDILSKKFNRPVELHLTRLHHPYQDSNILVNLLAMNLNNKRKKSRVLIKKIYNKKPVKNLNRLNLIMRDNIINNIKPNAFISGLNIKIAGRLMREPIIPRLTKKNFEKGARATGKINFLDSSSITSKNKKGAFTIKIISGQNFYI